MKYFLIDKRIDEEVLTEFSQFCNDNAGHPWTITITGNGGKPQIGRVIVNMINTNAENCTLISCIVYSTAFEIFYFAKCKKLIAHNTGGLVHMVSFSASVHPERGNKMYYPEDICISKTNKETPGFVKKILTKKEWKKYKKGFDVYFTFERMCEIFPEAGVI